MTATNYSTAVMLFNDSIRVVHTTYYPEKDPITGVPLTHHNGVGRIEKNDRVMYKTLDPSIKTGDLVVVPTKTRHGFTVVRVVDTEVEVDFDSDVEVQWIVNRVDTVSYNTILSEEARAIAEMKASQKKAKKAELRQNLETHFKDVELSNLLIKQETAA